jgi:Tol biopolymer transport system component
MSPAPGASLGSYEITGKLGEGGMGEVYRATDSRLKRDVAIKVLPPAFAADRERVARFEREAQLLAQLHHPHIASIFGLEESDGTLALVMELVEGEDLAALIERGPLPVEDVVAIARQIAAALEAAHDKEIIHRDLKPANIKITADGVVKVLDFGLAKDVTPLSARDLSRSPTVTMDRTGAGVILGTAAYMSPEQARGLVVDKRTDIWAFGCVLFEMLAGRPAFDGRTGTDVLVSVLERAPDWSALPDSTPRAVVRLLQRCLEKEPRRRLRDIADARADLDDAVRAEPAVDQQQARAAGVGRWGHVVWAAAAFAALIAGAAWRNWVVAPAVGSDLTRLAIPLGALRMPGETTPFALTRDGRRIVLATGENGLYVRDFADAVPRAVPGTAGASAPFFSPDGEWVGFVADGRLKKVAVTGGSPIVICELTGSFRGLAWSPDGTILIGMVNTTLMRVAAEGGGTPQPLSTLDPALDETSHRWPHVLPGGRAVVFAAGPSITATDWNAAQIVVQSIATGERRVIAQRGSSPVFAAGYLFYLSGRTLLAQAFDPDRLVVQGPVLTVATDIRRGGNGAGWFAVSDRVLVTARESQASPGTLAWLDSAGLLTPLPLSAGPYSTPRLSPDGMRVAVTVSNPDSDIWVYDVTRGNATRITSDGKSLWPIWSSDGAQIAFSSTRGAVSAIRSKRADGTGDEETLVQNSFINIARCWTDDGTLGYMQVEPGTNGDAWIRQPNGEVAVVARTRFLENGCPSPDGRWFAMQSDQSGRNEVYVQPLPPAEGARVQVSTGGASNVSWSADGRELYFAHGNDVLAAHAPEGPTGTFGEPRRMLSAPFSLETNSGGVPGHDIAPDGRALVIRRDAAPTSIEHLNVTLNWSASLTPAAR